MPGGNIRSCDHEEAQPDPHGHLPDLLFHIARHSAVVYSATKGALPLWSGEMQSMPRVYREAIIDHMFIFADASKISELVFALKDQSLDYGKE